MKLKTEVHSTRTAPRWETELASPTKASIVWQPHGCRPLAQILVSETVEWQCLAKGRHRVDARPDILKHETPRDVLLAPRALCRGVRRGELPLDAGIDAVISKKCGFPVHANTLPTPVDGTQVASGFRPVSGSDMATEPI